MTSKLKILAIDVGNSFTKIGCFIGDDLVAVERFPTEKDDPTGGYQEELKDTLTETLDIDGISVSCVVPSIKPALKSVFDSGSLKGKVLWFDDLLHREKNPGEEDRRIHGVDFSYYQQGQLGADRAIQVIFAHERFPNKKVAVCSFGTAATFDMVDETGLYIGGAICPGAKAYETLLNQNLAVQVREACSIFQVPIATPGLTTETCVQNGLYFGYKGMILEVVGNLLQSGGWPLSHVQFVFTGGDAEAVAQMVSLEIANTVLEPDAVLHQLYQLWGHTVGFGLKIAL